MGFGPNSLWSYLLDDAIGWLIFPIAFAIPLLSPEIRKNQTLLLACWFVIFLHQAATVTNTYLLYLPGGEDDANAFHHAAEAIGTRPALDVLPYTQALRAIYNAVGPSRFMGSELSVCCSAASLILFVDLCQMAKTRAPLPLLVLLFKMWPATLIHSSVTLREAYQVFAILCVGWSITALSMNGKQTRGYFVLVLGIVMLFNLHRGLTYYAIAVAGLAYLRLARNLPAILLSCCLALGLLATGVNQLRSAPDPSETRQLSQFEYAAKYREFNTGGRASYNVKIDLKTPHGFVASVTLCLFYYMFAPLPWMISGLPDLYALVESFSRMVLVAGMFYQIRASSGVRRTNLIFFAFMFWSVELLWAFGTANWGQAIRHRAIGYAYLVILGGDWWLARFWPPASEQPSSLDTPKQRLAQ